MNHKSVTLLSSLIIVLSCASLLGACARPTQTATIDESESLQSSALPPAGDAGQ
jgi:hypothetical protein